MARGTEIEVEQVAGLGYFVLMRGFRVKASQVRHDDRPNAAPVYFSDTWEQAARWARCLTRAHGREPRFTGAGLSGGDKLG